MNTREVFNSQPIVKRESLWALEGNDISSCQNLEEIKEASGLNFDVEKSEVYQKLPNGEFKTVDNQFHVRRTDNNKILTSKTVAGRYTPCQNDTFLKVLDSLREEGNLVFDTAGSVQYGKRVFAIGRFIDLEGIEVSPNDLITPYIGIWSSHDGNLPVVAKYLKFRHRCTNMNMAGYNNKGIKISIRHTREVNEKVVNAVDILLKMREDYLYTIEAYRRMKEIPLNTTEVFDLSAKILGIEQKEGEQLGTRQFNRIIEVVDLYKDEYYGNKGETAYDLYNAFTAHNTHKRTIKNGNSRLDNLTFGPGFNLDVNAFNTLSTLPV